MYPSQLEFLQHIHEECCFILKSVDGKTDVEIYNDPVLSRAIIRSLEIIGEASKKISQDLKNKYPQVDWKDMARLRDRLIHHYFGVDYEIVYDVITKDIPELENELKRIIQTEKA